jgi:hypothetical protein
MESDLSDRGTGNAREWDVSDKRNTCNCDELTTHLLQVKIAKKSELKIFTNQ